MDVSIISRSWSHVVLNWSSPFYGRSVDFADSYRLTISSKKDKISILTSETHARIDGLKQLTNYLLNVQAWNELGFGPSLPEDISFRTPGR